MKYADQDQSLPSMGPEGYRLPWGMLPERSGQRVKVYAAREQADGVVQELTSLGHLRSEAERIGVKPGWTVARTYLEHFENSAPSGMRPVWLDSTHRIECMREGDEERLIGQLATRFPDRHVPGHPDADRARQWRERNPLKMILRRIGYTEEEIEPGVRSPAATVVLEWINGPGDSLLNDGVVYSPDAIDDDDWRAGGWMDGFNLSAEMRFGLDPERWVKALKTLATDRDIVDIEMAFTPRSAPLGEDGLLSVTWDQPQV